MFEQQVRKIVPLIVEGLSWKEIVGKHPELVNSELKTKPTQQVKGIINKFMSVCNNEQTKEKLAAAMKKMRSSKGRASLTVSENLIEEIDVLLD